MQVDRFGKKVINEKKTQISYGGISLGSVLYGDFGKYVIESSRPTDEWEKLEEAPHFGSMEDAMAKLYEVYKPQPI